MDIASLYDVYIEAGRQPCKTDDPQRGRKMQTFRKAKQTLFEALMDAHSSGALQSNRADTILAVIERASSDPEGFWGSEKTASCNGPVFRHEKNERLFEELLRSWKCKGSVNKNAL